ncbi:type IV secretion system DNA-binding domain-containing protein [Candidatus Parcubacteria bacterium]|nr:type IV secretion system DNA-binding domain-containing protein [Candidatus Parcubacteria bacterium]
MYFLFTILIFIAFILAGTGWFLVIKKRKIKQLTKSLDMVLFLVRLPKYEKKEEKEKQDIKSVIGIMEQIYSNFLYLEKPNFIKRFLQGSPRIALEIASQTGGSDISFYVAVPTDLATRLEKNIQGLYPGAQVEKVPEDYTVFEPEGKVSGCYLKLKKAIYYPINTYKNLDRDPLASITNTLSKINPDEGAAVQIILRPCPIDLKYKGEKVLYKIREGKSASSAITEAEKSGIMKFFESFFEAVSPKKEEEKKGLLDKEKDKPFEEPSFEAIKTKIQKPVFDINIRLVSVAPEQSRAEEILDHLESGFSQFYNNFNEFKAVRIKANKLKQFIYNFSFRVFNKNQRSILNLEELTSIYHFPLSNIESPQIKWVKTKETAPPTELPSTGLNLIGKAVFRNEEKDVYFASENDRRRHCYIIGQTGTGKSSLLREMIRQDIEQGRGVAVIDPHGDLIEDTLANIPKERAEDVVLFEPFDLERPCGLNMLEWDTPEQKDFAVSEMIAIFSKLFPPEIIGPMFEHYMRNAMLALMADKENPGTLVEIPRIFTDDDFMKERLEKVKDPLVKQFWLKEWAQTTGETKSDMLGYVVSKVGRFVENEMMRNIIGQSFSGFDLAKIMDEGKIFLANLSKGQTGEMNSSLLGLILVSKMQLAAMKRGKLPEEQRKDFYLYIDEFQNFTTDTIATILSEARKYRLDLILAHQFIPQLTDEIRNAVIGNVGTIAAFRIGATDAEFLENVLEPEFSRYDLVNLDNFQFIVKMIIDNKVSSPFKVKTIKPVGGNPKIVEPVKKISKLKYGRPRALVEREIMERSRLG